jgi:2-polyprenyl-6-hydroxyphenyl methylase/3-demethylubiquinone-9 3-methyltransferase
MDLIEHVDKPEKLIAEASRVLRPGGTFVFHTFNRNWLANLIIIKGVAWFVKNAPPDLHVLHLFRTPEELKQMLEAADFELVELRGSRPRFRWPLFRMLLTGRVGDDFAFTFTPSTKLGYTGVARKRQRLRASMRVTPATRGSDSGERPSLPPSP